MVRRSRYCTLSSRRRLRKRVQENNVSQTSTQGSVSIYCPDEAPFERATVHSAPQPFANGEQHTKRGS